MAARIHPGEEQQFQTTLWTEVRDARNGHTTALNTLLVRYRPPVVRYLVHRGASPDDAEDLAQEVLLQVAQHKVLDRADASLGRFRNLILAVARNLQLKAHRSSTRIKRGGSTRTFSLSAPGSDSDLKNDPPSPGGDSDSGFDHEWVKHLIQLALDRLHSEHEDEYRALFLLTHAGLSYEEIATKLGKTWHAVNHAVRQARRRMVRFLRAEIVRYSSSPQEYEAELAYLDRFIKESSAL